MASGEFTSDAGVLMVSIAVTVAFLFGMEILASCILRVNLFFKVFGASQMH